ncbi:Destabilase [Popillia japonica]
MKIVIAFLIVSISFVQDSEQLQNLLNTKMHKCIECLCHARTGCYNRITCANYSINRSYWETAGSPSLPGDDPDDERSYTKCMQNENCILNTIVGYTSSFNNLDCNCDGLYDCQDMLKLHLSGDKCGEIMNQYSMDRFNNCAARNGLPRLSSNEKCKVEAE